ncbi:MAG: hypothetical protein LUI09_01770 [Prevotellaceae bacterium]|nr:hypothetical protein [Prevotellaceae bacterium]
MDKRKGTARKPRIMGSPPPVWECVRMVRELTAQGVPLGEAYKRASDRTNRSYQSVANYVRDVSDLEDTERMTDRLVSQGVPLDAALAKAARLLGKTEEAARGLYAEAKGAPETVERIRYFMAEHGYSFGEACERAAISMPRQLSRVCTQYAYEAMKGGAGL